MRVVYETHSKPTWQHCHLQVRSSALGRQPLCCAILLALLWVCMIGCAGTEYVTVRETPRNPLVDQLKINSRSGPEPSARTLQLLRRYDLLALFRNDPDAAMVDLQHVVAEEPTADKFHAFAELSFIRGKQLNGHDEQAALEYFETAVAHAYIYLFDQRFGRIRNPYDPQFRGACDLYNGALEESMRLLVKHNALQPGKQHQVETANNICDVTVVSRGTHWHDEDFGEFEFVSDYQVQGLTNTYESFGLGVPLVVKRKQHEEGATADEEFYPPGLTFPATAFLRVMPSDPLPEDGSISRHKVVLEFYDPLTSTDIMVGKIRVPLESDLSTPLAYFLNQSHLESAATTGLLRPDLTEKLAGLYMLQPYEPHKIPVIMVHGLWSSPLTWMEMFNDLLGSPELRDRYQFWFYMYPTGQPFWISAAQFRRDLAEMRQVFDPQRNTPALDQMVLVGHSMGGLVSKLQAVSSGDQYWDAVATEPFQLVKAGPELKETMRSTFFFDANPSVRRLITIATPHRGSRFANPATQWLGRKFITLPEMLVNGREQLLVDNPGLFRDASMQETKTSLDSLSPESPLLPVLLNTPLPPWVKHHNIVGVLEYAGEPVEMIEGGDGIVSYASAHPDNIESELIVNSSHAMVQQHPRAILEVRRVLLEHLRSLDGRQPESPWRFANQPASPATAPHTGFAPPPVQGPPRRAY